MIVDKQSPYRFTTLLLALIAFLMASPFISQDRIVGRITVLVLLLFMVATAAISVARSRRDRAIAGLLGVAGFACSLAGMGWLGPITIIGFGVFVLFFVFVIFLVLKHVVTCNEVNSDVISAALCVYLMLGFLWAFLYAIMEHSAPGSFSVPYASEGIHQIRDHLYFSFVTLTTLGYGDIQPIGYTARIFAVLEAIVGQIYLVVLVARLVGLHTTANTEHN